jgi:hypothetical protein
MAASNPLNKLVSIQKKIMRLAQFYPNEISIADLIRLDLQLETFIDDIRKYYRFKCVNNLGDISIFLVQIKKHVVYDLVYTLLKLILLLPVATANAERVFSAMCLVKKQVEKYHG